MHSTSGMRKTFWEYHKAFDHRLIAWKHEVLFTWQWWFGIGIFIFAWVIWIALRNRESTARLLFVGLFVALISLTLDNLGVQLSLWNYIKPVIPAIPAYIPFDFSIMPVSVMFLIQYFYKRNPWIIGVLFGLISSLIGESFFKWIGIYETENWQSIYSIPFYALIYVISHKLVLMKKFKELNE